MQAKPRGFARVFELPGAETGSSPETADLVAEDAVTSELVSALHSLMLGKIQGLSSNSDRLNAPNCS
jgi:hypothetical protein